MQTERPALIHVPGCAGVDEAGRGPLAGPVVVAAVVLPDIFDVRGIDDSKKMSRSAREVAARRIKSEALWRIEVVSVEEIDRHNVLRASLLGMARAMEGLEFSGAYIDGDWRPPTARCVECVVKGDGKYACIAAASILAKTERDALMVSLASEYPQYGFDINFGYGTPEHLFAIRELGPCPIHRRSFSPVCEMVNQPCLTFDA